MVFSFSIFVNYCPCMIHLLFVLYLVTDSRDHPAPVNSLKYPVTLVMVLLDISVDSGPRGWWFTFHVRGPGNDVMGFIAYDLFVAYLRHAR